MEKEATRTCEQCHKEVAEVNFTLHETHCSRFLCICPDCDEAIPREQMNQHKEEQHTQVKCSKCNLKMERRHLTDHEADECVERLQACQFCELQLPWKQLDQHSLVCGSRTELCKDCNHYVKLRDQPDHGSTCSATGNGSTPPQTSSTPANMTPTGVNYSRFMASFPAEDTDKRELDNPVPGWYYDESESEDKEKKDALSQQVNTVQLSNAYKATSPPYAALAQASADGGDPYQISSCPHCHLALPLLTLRWHEAKCQIYILLR
ncbi:XIAP-associated factor 1 isoform X2 [Echeneis naucrates]|uniref:XIAP-associated factor 1 isoform X2 n=1 Tax=Echeneis naucrates TaxID=173247 RepID=UPI001113A7BF|nr:XIAP-associated factor 1 isoform X2 [Echeneis naucrates]